MTTIQTTTTKTNHKDFFADENHNKHRRVPAVLLLFGHALTRPLDSLDQGRAFLYRSPILRYPPETPKEVTMVLSADGPLAHEVVPDARTCPAFRATPLGHFCYEALAADKAPCDCARRNRTPSGIFCQSEMSTAEIVRRVVRTA